MEEESEFSGFGDPVVTIPDERSSSSGDDSPAGRILQDPAAARLLAAGGYLRADPVPVQALLQHLSSALPDLPREWLRSLTQVLDPTGEDGAVTEAVFREAVGAVSRANRDLLQP
ncbi:uncharacterized protein LOC119091633 [Pollicipes pollicipes]|uniref:uncharacterized protein LOC119091633 n=1 Tax=Pollicipes pollicipes TaxID=41117 RepID=UPI001884E669|nr:uncharacterized protein LOC119091633 [Pollicipes pollicipes]